MSSSNYAINGGYMYDLRGREVAMRNSNRDYVDSNGHVRATSRESSRASTRYSYTTAPENKADILGPVTDPDQSYFSSRSARLSSSKPGRTAPSSTRTQTVTGSLQYPEGFPRETSGLRPQSAAGNPANPENPEGHGYDQSRIPFPHGSPIRSRYKAYKDTDEAYKNSFQDYKDQRVHNAGTIGTVGGKMSEKLQYTQQGHQVMSDYAHTANMAGLTAATKRLDFTSDNYGRVPRKGHPGHLEQAASRATYAEQGSPAQLSRQHEHYARGGSAKEWHEKKGSYEISNDEWADMEDSRIRRMRAAQEYRKSHHSNEHGRQISNGKYEWIEVGGGRRRYWSDEYDDYVELASAQS